VTFLEEGLTGRLVGLLAAHTLYDLEVLECLHSIGRRLLRDSPHLAEPFHSSLRCLNVDIHINDSLELYGTAKKLKETVLGWLCHQETSQAWRL